jgi:hypothetical protein
MKSRTSRTYSPIDACVRDSRTLVDTPHPRFNRRRQAAFSFQATALSASANVFVSSFEKDLP